MLTSVPWPLAPLPRPSAHVLTHVYGPISARAGGVRGGGARDVTGCVAPTRLPDASGGFRGTGFVRFVTRKDGEAAIMGLHGRVMAATSSRSPLVFLPPFGLLMHIFPASRPLPSPDPGCHGFHARVLFGAPWRGSAR